ncbi:MAG: 4Fe-4S ferredoxin, partial [Rhizobiales bacterium]|nr:4Fe-4S ferredoxin [Hyphomicrobiales bacterium]
MLKLFVSGAALALSSCGPPHEEIVPYVEIPEREVPGLPLQFATALSLAGYGRGVVVTSVEGRPIKIEGNPRHPASLGATDIYAEAAVLSLYDPDRSRAPYSADRIQPWTAFEAALQRQIQQEDNRQGAGLSLLTGRITSPTLIAQIGALRAKLPQMKWHRYEPIEDDAVRAGATQAFGKPATALPRFGDARVALMLDADPLACGPAQIRFGHDIVGARRSHNPQDSLRLYAVEPVWTLTGALADHRLPLRPELIGDVAIEIARGLGAALPETNLPQDAMQFVKAAAADLNARPGAAVVVAGPRQRPDIHALCHWINNALGAPVDFIAPVDPIAEGHGESLWNLADDLRAQRVSSLIMIGVNPAYDAPGDLGFADLIAAAPFSAHLGIYNDETATRATWHLPMTHVLESWSDIRAFDGTASIVQPLIRPLYDTRSAHELIALRSGSLSASPYALVRDYWQGTKPAGDFKDWWRQLLQDGVVANTAAAKLTLPSPALPQVAPSTAHDHLTLTLAPDPSLFDGSMANNAWLQECPTPFTKQVWGNALHIAKADARELGVDDGDVVRISDGQRTLEMPVLVRPGQAARVAAATLGHGRTRAGSIGNNVGFDVYPLRRIDSPWALAKVTVQRTGKRQNLLLTQHYFKLDGEAEELQPRFTLADLAKGDLGLSKPGGDPPTLYPKAVHDTYEWAMVVDNSACIGCNAC